MEFWDQSVKDPKCGILSPPFFVLTALHGLQDLINSLQQRDYTQAHSSEMLSPNHWTCQGNPFNTTFKCIRLLLILILFIEAITRCCKSSMAAW